MLKSRSNIVSAGQAADKLSQKIFRAQYIIERVIFLAKMIAAGGSRIL